MANLTGKARLRALMEEDKNIDSSKEENTNLTGKARLRSLMGMEETTSVKKQVDPLNLKQKVESFQSLSLLDQVKKIAPSYTDLTSEKNIPITERTGQSSRTAREKQAEREAMRYTRPAPSLPQDQFEIDQTIPVSEHIAFDTKGQIQNKKYNLQVEGWRNQFESVNMLPDFRQMVERGKKRIATDQFKTGGFGDAAQYMNDPQTYTVLAAQSTGRATDPRRLAKMSDTEKETLLYFIGAGDDESAKKYFDDVVVRDLNRRYQTEANEKLKQFSNEHKVLGAGVNILSSVAQSGALVETIRQAIENQITGQYKPVDPYSPRSEAANIVKYTTEGITEDMGLTGQTVASSLLSLGQMGVLIPFGGPAISAIMGMNAAGGTALEAAYNGDDPARALATSIASGLIEWGTEKLPIDNLFRIAKGGKSVSNSMVKEVLRQAGIEGTEELISDYANTLTDIALNGNQSAYNRRVQELMQSGMNAAEAEKQTQLEMFVIQPVMSFAGGGIAGGIGGGTAAGISVISDYQQSQSQNQPYLYPNDGKAIVSDMNPALQQRINALEIQPTEDLSAGQSLQPDRTQSPVQDMGESGQKAWAQISQNAAAEDAAEQFDRYYKAGKLGIPQNKIPENVSENPITPSQAAQAYFAGVNDAQTEQTAAKSPQTEASFYEAGKNGASLESVFSSLGENADIPAKAAALQEWAAGRTEQNVSVKRNTTGQQTTKNNGGLVNNRLSRTFSVQARDTLNQIGKALGVQIEFSDASDIGNGYYSNGKIVLSAQNENAVSDILKHELTHYFQQTAPQEYEAYSRYVIDAMAQADPEYLVSEMERTKNLYEAYTGENYSDQAVIDEIVADFTANFTDRPEELLQFAKENRSIAQRIADSLHEIIVKLRNALEKTFGVRRDLGQSERYNPYGLALEQFEQAEALWREALRGSGKLVVKKGSASYGASKKDPSIKSAEPLFDNTIAQKSGDVNSNIRKNGGNDTKQYSLNAGFAQELDEWLQSGKQKQPASGRFYVGTTSDALKSIGVDDYKIYWNKSKIAKIMKEHPEMTADVIKKVPDILEHPILVMQSQTVANRITLFGETMDVGGNPVLAAIELRPQNKSGEVMDFAVISSAYGKRGVQHLIDTSDILYLDPNKKRTDTWLKLLRLQLPSRITKYGSITNVTYVNRNVKGDISFGSEESESAMEAALRKAIQESEAKHSSHSSVRKNAENDTRKFSLSSPVEEAGDLVALHNLTEDKLLKSLQLGGMPMPSIAVTKSSIPHTNFGDITLVMDKRSIDPKANRKNIVYSADAWTPTFPAVEYEADEVVVNRISQRIGELSAQVDPFFQNDLRRIQYGMEEYLNRYGGEEGLVDWATGNYGLKAAYLEEQGHHIEPVTIQRETERGYNPERAEKYRAIVKVLGTDDPDEIDRIPLKELRDRHGDALEQAFPGMTKSTLRLNSIIKQVKAYLQSQGGETAYETVTDATATRQAIDDALDKDRYEKWVKDLYSGIQVDSGIYNNKDRFTPAGNRRTFQQTHYPVTLENIVKAMKGQNDGNTKNVSGFYGVKSLRAGTAKRFKSIADMHKLEGRLQNMTEEQTKAIYDELDRRLMDITEALAEKSPNRKGGFDYYLADSIGNILVEITAGETYTIDAIMKKFNGEYGFHIGNELAAQVRDLLYDVSQMPVNIFEAKPERVVGFDEALAAVIPNNSSSVLMDALEERGVNVLTYESGNNIDRLEKVNSVEGAKFAYATSLERENARLKERLNHFKGQLKRTKKITFEEKTVNRIARDKLKEYDSGADVPSVAGKIQTLYEYIANGDGKEHNVSWTEVKSQLNEIAAEIAENARILDDTLYQQYAPLRKQLQGNTYYFDPQSRADLETAGGYNAIRKHNMGRFFLSADPGKTGIDTLYDKLNAEFGSTLFPEEITNPADQLVQISQVLDDLQPIIVENPYSADMQMVIEHIGNEILEQFFETPQVKPTFADRQAQKLDETNRRWRQKYDQAIIKERTKREEKLAALRQKYQSKDAKARERREAGDLRVKIERHVSKLSQKLLRPTDKQHIPEPLRQAVADMLQSINLESSFVIDPETGKRVKQGTAKAEAVDNPEPVKRTQAFSELRRQYEEIAKENSGYNLVLDPNLLENLQKVADMKQIRIADMNTEQLTTIWNTVKAVEASISTENRTLSDLKYKSTSEMANRLHEDLADRHMRRNFRSGVLNRIDGAINLDMLSPETYFHRMGEVGDELFRAMRRAEDQQTRILAEATDYTQEVLKKFSGKTKTREIGKTVRDLERETHSFQMEGGNIELSTAQIMELYNLSKRDQSLDHIYVGGIRPDANTGKGIFEQRKARPVKVTPQDVQRIINSLTDSQRKLADQMMEFLSGRMAEYGNRASVDVYGYEKFKEPNYWPIKADENQTRSEVGQNEVKAVPNYGMTQATNPNASNAVMIGSVFDTYTQHISEMATYSAWLKTWYDVDRLRNYTSWQKNEGQDKMGRAWTVPELIEQLYGKNGNKYWLKLMEDIAKGTKAKADTVFSMDKITGNYKAASVGANIRVILQQPTSYLRAGAVMDWEYLSKAMFTGRGWKKAKQYAPIAQWKDWGYFDISTGRNVKDIITGSDSALEWARQKSMTLASKADSFTWGRIWNACELETADTRPDLTRGSEAFYEAAAERFAEIIDRTQVVDSVMQRTQVMRSENALNRMATSFMSEPSKVYNMAIRALYDFKDAKGEEKKKAGKALARTVFSLIVSFAANSVAQSIVDAWREDELEKKYGERFVDAWAENFTSNFNPLSYIPYARDLVSVAQGYDVARMDMEPFAKLFKTAETAFKSIQGEGKYSTAAAMANLFAEGGRLLGLPVANIKRDVEGILTAASYELDQYMMQYQILSLTRNLNNDANKSTVYGLLYDAKQKDMAAYNKIKEDLVSKYGYDPDDLEEAVEKVPYNRAKKEERFQREVKQKQKEAQTSLENSSYFRRMTVQEQKSAIGQLEKWASDTVKEKNKVGELERKWKRQKESGISLNQYVIYNTFEGNKEEKIQRSMEVFRMSEEEAAELYYKIQSYLYAGDTLNEAQEENLAEAKEAGFTEAQFRKAYNALRGVEGTKLRSGRTVEGSRKRNMLKALREAGFTSAQANKLYNILQGRSED